MITIGANQFRMRDGRIEVCMSPVDVDDPWGDFDYASFSETYKALREALGQGMTDIAGLDCDWLDGVYLEAVREGLRDEAIKIAERHKALHMGCCEDSTTGQWYVDFLTHEYADCYGFVSKVDPKTLWPNEIP